MKRFLITGASGFLGKTIASEVGGLGEVITMGSSSDNMIVCDLRKQVPKGFKKPEVVIHAAGKAHSIPKTKDEVEDFFHLNYQGTVNLLAGLEQAGSIPARLVFISTVAVYGKEFGEDIDEEFPLSGNTPYAQSKIQAEAYLTDWCKVNDVRLTVLRLPLVVGNDAPGNLGQMIQMMKRGLYFGIGKGTSRRSMVLAKDVARFVIPASKVGGIFNLTDGVHPTMVEFEQALASALGVSPPGRIPLFIAHTLAKVGDWIGNKFPINSDKLAKLTSSLTFSEMKARNTIGWNPTSVIDNLNKVL